MTTNFKTRSRKLFVWASVLFVAMFAYRIIYGYVEPSTRSNVLSPAVLEDSYGSSFENTRKNYASEKIVTKNSAPQAIAIAASQKFEKTASIRSRTSEFGKDEARVKQMTKDYNAVIQYEQQNGQPGDRQVHLLIGVIPDKFDSFYADIQKIGIIKSHEITKVDKTNEYMKLNAQKASLENTLRSLTELKSKGGQLSDLVALHDKILEIEERIQGLGVELGNFDPENEFCTIKLSMYESDAPKGITVMRRIKVALEWTIKYYSVTVFTILGLSLTVLIILAIVDKLKVMTGLSGKA